MKKILLILVLIGTALLSSACTSKSEKYISAKNWESKYPNIYASYLENAIAEEDPSDGAAQVDYLEKYPYLKTLYAGNSFSVEYLQARGHLFAIEDVMNTERSKPGASCLSCKTSAFLEHLEENGVEGNAMKFEDVANAEMESISCYDCHKNEPGILHVTRAHLTTALEGIGKEFSPKELACAQCHVEYQLDPKTKEVIMPSVNGLTPSEMLAFYDEAGYSDWTHPQSGAALLKVQHPEWETFQGSIHQQAGLSCVSCHMPKEAAENGETSPSHHWTSPLETIETSCLSCHDDYFTAESLTARVERLQSEVEEKMNECAYLLVDLINSLEQAVKDGKDEATLTEARAKHRAAQWYWDFVFVENSEGYHNKDLTMSLLNQAKTLTEEGMALLN